MSDYVNAEASVYFRSGVSILQLVMKRRKKNKQLAAFFQPNFYPRCFIKAAVARWDFLLAHQRRESELGDVTIHQGSTQNLTRLTWLILLNRNVKSMLALNSRGHWCYTNAKYYEYNLFWVDSSDILFRHPSIPSPMNRTACLWTVRGERHGENMHTGSPGLNPVL